MVFSRLSQKLAAIRKSSLSDLPALFGAWLSFPSIPHRRRVFSPHSRLLGLPVPGPFRGPLVPGDPAEGAGRPDGA